jgi:hypothetical protein
MIKATSTVEERLTGTSDIADHYNKQMKDKLIFQFSA